MKEHLVEFDTKMTKTMNNMRGEFSSIRAGRANPAVLDKIRVDYYGTPTPINQMAAVSVSEARILVIQPWDKSSMKAIEKERVARIAAANRQAPPVAASQGQSNAPAVAQNAPQDFNEARARARKIFGL